MPDIIFLMIASAILLIVFVYTFAFWFGYGKGVEDTAKQTNEEDKVLPNTEKEDEFYQGLSPSARALYDQIMGGACKDGRSSKGKGSFTATLSPRLEFDSSPQRK